VTVPPSTDPSDLYGADETAAGQQNDGRFLWLATGDLPGAENPLRSQLGLARLLLLRGGPVMSSLDKHLATRHCPGSAGQTGASRWPIEQFVRSRMRPDDGQPDLPSGGPAELPGGGQNDYFL
jgi:hypothetical protein